MKQKLPKIYLLAHRRKSGLSQEELGFLLGYPNDVQVSRHERGRTQPPLHVAMAYEALFRVPISKLFPELMETVTREIENRLSRFHTELGKRSAKDPDARRIARKMEWLEDRHGRA